MDTFKQLFEHTQLLLFDEGVEKEGDEIFPFAYTDLLTVQVGQDTLPVLHFWEFADTVILGMKDTRIPNLKNGLKLLSQQQYRYLARNSGGLAVVADEGVLNLSMIIPNNKPKINIPDAYELMVALMRLTFSEFPVTVEAKEIADSYCPGDYDLSINGKKFAGIAQRRVRDGIAVMIYISVNGNQAARGQLIQQFYQTGLGNDFGENGYPPVRPSSMATVNELLHQTWSVDDMKQRIISVFSEQLSSNIQKKALPTYVHEKELMDDFHSQLEKMKRRNEQIMEIMEDKDENTL